jgi:site-specific recombinase XerD/transcriptional regulator with XRE-family HTH domain
VASKTTGKRQRKFSMQINDLRKYRYSITDLINEHCATRTHTHTGVGVVRLTMSLTYLELTKIHLEKLRQDDASEQVIRNHSTAIRGWQKSLSKADSSYVGTEFSEEHFADAVDLHLTQSSLAKRSAADRRSLLRAWQSTYRDQFSDALAPQPRRERRSSIASGQPLSVFELTLKSALARQKLTPKKAARLAGISMPAIGRWSRGALPNKRSTPSLQKLEALLELPTGTLAKAWDDSIGKQKPIHINPYRIRNAANQKLNYVLNAEVASDCLVSEWRALLAYKTCLKPPGKQRRSGSKWSLVPTIDTLTKRSCFTMVGQQVSPSAEMAWNHIGAFLGFLSLPLSTGGQGIPVADSQTLAWLAVPECLEGFLTFKTIRSDGLVHAGHAGFCATVAGLTHLTTGYLTQSPELLERLPKGLVGGRSWLDLCAQSHEFATLFKTTAKDKSRDPALAIQYFLEQDNPLQPVLSAIETLDRIARTAPEGSQEQLVAKRDRILLGLLLANPLRLKHWVTLGCCRPGTAGDVYRTHRGAWRIRIPGKQFKNRARVGAAPYDAPIPERLSPLLEDYVQNVRPRLLGNKPDSGEFLLSGNGKRFNGLGQHVLKLTKKMIAGSGGIGAHAFRHLVATDWLTKNPNDFLTVAELLNDSLAVVIKDYAHLKKDVAFSRYEAYVNKMLAQGDAWER